MSFPVDNEGLKANDHSYEEGNSSRRPRRKRGRACAACAIQHLRCERETDNGACSRCIKLVINCVNRASRKAVNTTGDLPSYSGQNAKEPVQTVLPAQSVYSPCTLPLTLAPRPQSSFAAFMDSGLITKLVACSSRLKLSVLPLVPNLDLQEDYTNAGSLLNMELASQALLLSVAALSARYVTPQTFDYLEAPTLSQLSQSPAIRQGTELCLYGKRRERPAQIVLEVASKVLFESHAFTEPSIRSVAALTTMESVTHAFRYSNSKPHTWDQRIRLYSAATAAHLRSLAEASLRSGVRAPRYFRSTAWTCILRDALVAAFTGRGLHYTSNDLRAMIQVDEDANIPIPAADSLVTAWIDPLEKSPLSHSSPVRNLFAVVLQQARLFVNRVTSPTASKNPELEIAVIENLFKSFGKVRLALLETRIIATGSYTTGRDIPMFARTLWFSTDFCLLQAHKVLLRRICEADACVKGDGQAPGIYAAARAPESAFERVYSANLQALRRRSDEEVFQASQRVAFRFDQMLKATTANHECFLPGYALFEDLASWVDVITHTKYTGQVGGRTNYLLSKKLADLRVFREVMSLLGWSYGDVQPQIESLNQTISDLKEWEALESATMLDPSYVGVLYTFPS